MSDLPFDVWTIVCACLPADQLVEFRAINSSTRVVTMHAVLHLDAHSCPYRTYLLLRTSALPIWSHSVSDGTTAFPIARCMYGMMVRKGTLSVHSHLARELWSVAACAIAARGIHLNEGGGCPQARNITKINRLLRGMPRAQRAPRL